MYHIVYRKKDSTLFAFENCYYHEIDVEEEALSKTLRHLQTQELFIVALTRG